MMMPVECLPIVWIKSNDDLATHCEQWLDLPVLAVDTEFVRTDTFFPIPGLIQIGTGQQAYFIDPLCVDNWQPFRRVLENPSTVKVLHACSEDLEIFQVLMAVTPQPVFDTQLVAAFAGVGFSLGYQKLVKQLTGIDLPKGETRSDWCHRPLTEKQEEYAALDVTHLMDVYRQLSEMLVGMAAKVWVEEDCSRLSSGILVDNSMDAWRSVKRAWQLKPQQLAVLSALCVYQEGTARVRNVPRTRVIPKESLWFLARYQPASMQSLAAIKGMKPRIINNDGKAILAVIKAAAQLPEAEHPDSLPGPLPKQARAQGKRVQAFIAELADTLALPVEVLLPSKVTTSILRSQLTSGDYTLPDSLQGWRRTVIGQPLIAFLNASEAG